MAVWVLFAFSFYLLSILNVCQLKQEQKDGQAAFLLHLRVPVRSPVRGVRSECASPRGPCPSLRVTMKWRRWRRPGPSPCRRDRLPACPPSVRNSLFLAFKWNLLYFSLCPPYVSLYFILVWGGFYAYVCVLMVFGFCRLVFFVGNLK